MLIRALRITGALLLPAATTAAQVDSTRPLARPVGVDSSIPKRPFLAMGQALAINVLVNRFDAWVLRAEWAKASLRSWGTNLELGWEWDEDSFQTNMFGHPYHGGLYFNAARSNGMSYWESAPVSFLGSWTWEYLGENYRPSLNDFFMTSFGGIALGEMFHRIGATIRDNTVQGGKRVFREFAAMPLDPVGGLNRLMRGEWNRRRPNPPEHDPGAFVVRIHAGARFEQGWTTGDSVERLPVVVADLVYGDPFLRPYRAPFDAFNVRAIISGGSGFNVLRATGRLYGSDMNDRSRRTRHLFAINQRYDYVSNPAQSIGGQSVEFGIYSRWRLGRGTFGIRTSVFGDIVLLGAIDAPNSGLGERVYDFGPGAGGRLQIALERSGLRFITLFLQGEFIHSVSGAAADHGVLFGGWEINVPIARGLGLAFHATNFNRVSHYTDPSANPRTDRRYYPEVRILAVWTKFGFSPAP